MHIARMRDTKEENTYKVRMRDRLRSLSLRNGKVPSHQEIGKEDLDLHRRQDPSRAAVSPVPKAQRDRVRPDPLVLSPAKPPFWRKR